MKRRRPRRLRKKRAAQQARARVRKQQGVHTDKVKDLHHLCWIKKKWNKGYYNTLRNHWYFKVMIPKMTLHREIHALIPGIPLPDAMLAKQAVARLRLLEAEGRLHRSDSVEQRLRLLASFFPDTPTGKAFEKQLSIVRNFNPPV